MFIVLLFNLFFAMVLSSTAYLYVRVKLCLYLDEVALSALCHLIVNPMDFKK